MESLYSAELQEINEELLWNCFIAKVDEESKGNLFVQFPFSYIHVIKEV